MGARLACSLDKLYRH